MNPPMKVRGFRDAILPATYRHAQAVARQFHQFGGELAGLGILDHQFFHDVSFHFLTH